MSTVTKVIPGGRRLRVALASAAPFLGGAEVAAERLAVGLRDAGHDVLVLLGRSGVVLEHMEAVGLTCTVAAMPLTDKWRWLNYLTSRSRIARRLREFRPDFVHANDLPTHQIVSDAARSLGVPRICHHRYTFNGAAVEWMNKFGCEFHVFVSDALREDLQAASPRLRQAPGAVVHDGLALNEVPDETVRVEARGRLGLPFDRVIVTFAGQIIERKGVAELIRAWSSLREGVRAAAELVIVGDDLGGQGGYADAMRRLARDLNCPARFVGFRRDVATWLAASDISVVPSHVEPLGNATLEAMAQALPVIATSVGGIPEMVIDGKTGLLIPPRAPEALVIALERLLGNAEERRRMGRAGRLRCEREFSIAAHVVAVEDVYRKALATSGEGSRIL